jgi:phospholipid/cholesterol/gamma-HCH transport system substrate-binding protein
MKISNETKIGVLAAIAITLLILGFNFLKGRNLFEHSKKIYAVFNNVEGLDVSNAVRINGLQVGTVYKINESDRDMANIVVTISLNKDINIPRNSVAFINSGLVSSSSIVITKGDSREFLQDGDTLTSQNKLNLVSQIEKNIDPIVARLNGTLESLDSLVQVIGSMFDPRTKNNITSLFAHLAQTSASLETLMNPSKGSLARSLSNLDTFTNNLAKNNTVINGTLGNLQKTSEELSKAKIADAVKSIQSTMDELKTTISKINSSSGTIGLLMNDKKLYQNLESTTRSLNILLDDFRVHPKRYVNVSVFGKKDKSAPLSAPISDTTSKPGNH